MTFYGPNAQDKVREFERLIFNDHPYRPDVCLGPDDNLPNLVSRIKGMLKPYYRGRAVNDVKDHTLSRVLTEIGNHRIVVPGSFNQPITCFAELRDAILAMSGKHGWNNPVEYDILLAAF
jgi:hypothetical protein